MLRYQPKYNVNVDSTGSGDSTTINLINAGNV